MTSPTLHSKMTSPKQGITNYIPSSDPIRTLLSNSYPLEPFPIILSVVWNVVASWPIRPMNLRNPVLWVSSVGAFSAMANGLFLFFVYLLNFCYLYYLFLYFYIYICVCVVGQPMGGYVFIFFFLLLLLFYYYPLLSLACDT
jgi:hypothetical protein